MKTIRYTLTLLLLAGLALAGKAQNVEQLAKADPLSLSGHLRLGFQYFDGGGEVDGRLPFSYVLTGTPTLSVFGFDIPVSISYRDGQLGSQARSPFNRYGISPSYKWVKLHLGQSNMRLAPYTLSGKNVAGLGVELTPGPLRIAALRGTLDNYALRPDSLSFLSTVVPMYERQVLGGALGYHGKAAEVELSFLKVKDDVASMSDPVDSTLADPPGREPGRRD